MPTLFQLRNTHSNISQCDCCKRFYKRSNPRSNHYCGGCRRKIHSIRRMVLASRFWHVLLLLAGGICPSCGLPCTDFTVDHIIPLSKTWDWHWRNLQPLCHLCNVRKGKKRRDYRPNWWVGTIQDLENTGNL